MARPVTPSKLNEETIAGELGLKVETATDLQRGKTEGDLTQPVVTRIFATPLDKAESAELVQYLPLLQNSGMLRRRSCAEAQLAAHPRSKTLHLGEVAGEQDHIVSPLWYNLDEYTDNDRFWWSVFRGTWCLNSIALIASLHRLQRGPGEFKALERYLRASR